MRDHIVSSLKRAIQRLQPCFHLHDAKGATYTRSTKKPAHADVGAV